MTGHALRSAAFALAAGLALAGCKTLEPHYDRPAAPVPQGFPSGGAYSEQTDTTAASSIRWDAFFTDARLRQVIGMALTENRDLRTALANIEVARARYRIQRSELFPTIAASANAAYGHTGDYGVVQQGVPSTGSGVSTPSSGAGGTGGGSIGGGVQGQGDYRYYSVALGVSAYELDLFGRVRSLTKEALETYLATAEAARTTRISLISETASDYITLAADRQRLKVAQDTVAADESIFNLTQARFTGGIASELDVRQAQTAVEQARSDVSSYATAAARDLDALNLVVGSPVPEELLPKGIEAALPTVADAPTGLSSAVLLDRPDVLQAEHTLKSYNADIGAARAAFFPTIQLTASGGTTSLYLDKLFASGTGVWSLSPNISLPIFDGGQRRADLARARAQKTAAVASYERAIQAAFRDVADALAQRGTVDALIAAQERLVGAASTTLRLSQARYQRGADTFLNTLDAQRTLYSGQQTLVNARAIRALNLVELYRALGGGADAQPGDAATGGSPRTR